MPKIIRSYIKLFENNRIFNVLNVTSRLVSVCFASFIYILTQDFEITFVSLCVGVLGVDLIFFILRLRESQFKSALFFEKNETSQKTMNKYTTAMLCIRILLMGLAAFILIKFDNFTPSRLVDAMVYYAVISYICNFFLNGFVFKYDPQIVGIHDDSSEYMKRPGTYGASGYGAGGAYTGDSSSIGGICG